MAHPLGGIALAVALFAAALGLESPFAREVAAQGKGGGKGGNRPPVITEIYAVQIPGNKFRVFGTVEDEYPAGCSVTFGGVGAGTTACDNRGVFDVELNIASLGNLTATPGDGIQGGAAETVTLGNDAPEVTITAQPVGGQWVFSGTVSDEAPAGLIVVLTGPEGVNGAWTTVTTNGTWQITLNLAPGASGFVTANVEDWYGEEDSATTLFGS